VKADLVAEGIVDPLAVKLQALIGASSAAVGMIKIDDLHIAKSAVDEEASNVEAQIAGRTRELIEAEREPMEFKYKGGRLKYPGTESTKPTSVYRRD